MDGWCFRTLRSFVQCVSSSRPTGVASSIPQYLRLSPVDRDSYSSESGGSRVRSLAGLVSMLCLGCLISLFACSLVEAQEAEWIWTPEQRQDRIPQGSVHFRKTFNLRKPEAGEITIAADDYYELYLNNRKLGSGRGTDHLDKYNVSQYLNRGRNVIAIKVENRQGKTAALVARVQVKETNGQWVSHSTDNSWKTSKGTLPLWTLPVYNDRGWKTAQSLGKLGTTAPWDRADDVDVVGQTEHKRFQISQEFEVKRILDDETTGSLIGMAFNEFGQIIASQEGGPLMLFDTRFEDGQEKGESPLVPRLVSTQPKAIVYCDEVTSCQGILPLNGHVFVTGEGPDGLGLYKLSDQDRDGRLEKVETLCQFTGVPGEHGPHGLTLGPDGMLYVVIGNHSSPEGDYAETSPHRNFYEGDTVTPRYEDPGGHASGVKTPGGAIIRMSLDGSKRELVAGGLRNAYDLAFNESGDLFVHDSDMESDLGTSWYRPTRVYQIASGGDYGWRSGWSKFPEYYMDNLPSVADTGRGSPTGAVVYNHVMFPTRYHDALFLGDWSEGRILVVRTKRQGATLTGNTEVFMQGDPLNVTDLDIGPDGAIYFCTGGRGTNGGVYRIAWRGDVPEAIRTIPEDLSGAIRQPQFHSAYARQRIAGLKIKLGRQWGNQLRGVALSTANPPYYRTRALDLLKLFGPQPDPILLKRLYQDQNEEVRAKTAQLLGLHNTPDSIDMLTAMLEDSDRNVRRLACDSLARLDAPPSFEALERMLISDDRFECWSARRLLERIPPEQWRDQLLETENHRLFVQGALALIIVDPTKRNSYDVLARVSEFMRGFISDRNFIDMLRVTQLALVRGEVDPADIPAFCDDMSQEFPSGNTLMNRELARILAFLDVADIGKRYVDYLQSDTVEQVDKLHLAMHLPFIKGDWTSEQRLAMMDYLERARVREGGGSYEHYVMKACRDFAQRLKDEDIDRVLDNAYRWPNAAFVAFFRLPKKLDEETIAKIKKIDAQIGDEDDDSYNQLKIGVVALLARQGDESSLEYLREMWYRDPERRSMIAMGLAEQPEGENWHLLVSSLRDLDEKSGPAVLTQLKQVQQRPEDPEYYRQVILLGLKLEKSGYREAVNLLRFWTGEQVSLEDDDWETAMSSWQDWYSSNYPDRPPAELPKPSTESKYEFAELLEYLDSDEGRLGDEEAGKEVYATAKCATCHKFDREGENIGPDLSKVARRFTRREILESIVYPSHVISDQYASKVVITLDGRQLQGMIAQGSDGNVVVIDSEGKRTEIDPDDIEEMAPSRVSSMPANLLDELTLEQIADLFAYLGAGRKPTIAQRNSKTKR